MSHFHSISEALKSKTWLTIGSFDGVHLGHQELIKKMVTLAHSQNELATVISFFPHPAVVLRGIKSPYYLTGPDEKARLLESLGVDQVITIPFTLDLAVLSAYDFMKQITGQINITNLFTGYDFSLGRQREGDISTLTSIGQELGYSVLTFNPVLQNHEPVSSRLIRSMLQEGNIEKVSRLLGRHYKISGRIVHGDGRGRIIGIPTTNLDYDSWRLLPRPGIYSTYITIQNKKYCAVTNIGNNPTFIEAPFQKLRVESHILDFSEDVYNENQDIEFVHFIRTEIRFDHVEDLITQIHNDILYARKHLGQSTNW